MERVAPTCRRRCVLRLPALWFAVAGAVSALEMPGETAGDASPAITIYTAKTVVTLDPERPAAEAVAVVGDRIFATGSVDDLREYAGSQPHVIDRSFAGQVIVPGFIAQHDHPFLVALTMTSEIIAIEDWVLPSRSVPAALSPSAYRARLRAAEQTLADPREPLFSWGYHGLFHGDLTRADLDAISRTRPIAVLHRSVHELIANSPALERFGIDEAVIESLPEAARSQVRLDEGHFWEAGLFALLERVLPVIAPPERVRAGLELAERYLHANGVTVGAEPGGIYSQPIQEAINAVFSDAATPFRYYFIPDGKSIYALGPDSVIARTEDTLSWGRGRTAILPKQIKLFADGSVYSQLMQLREPYLDGHAGEWIMLPQDFAAAFRAYWEAGYQIHVHATGDAGVDLVLDNLEVNMRRQPRRDHRTVLVHVALAQPDQVRRAARLGAVFSANPYYVTMLADRFSEEGLGPERADAMVPSGDIERAGVSLSFHSDMPMAPAQPLLLMDSAVNRTTVSGRIAGPDQRVSPLAALRAVTIDAAYSLRLEDTIGSIEAGKVANFSVLSDNPLTVPVATIRDIRVVATVQEGRKLPVESAVVETATVR